MGQPEYKILKMPLNMQEFYSNVARSFGWQIQNMQEGIDRLVNLNMGFSTTYSFRTIPMSWGSRSGASVTNIISSLTVTYARDLNLPNRNEILKVETRCWQLVDWWVDTCRENSKWDYEMKEYKEIQQLQNQGVSLLQQSQTSSQIGSANQGSGSPAQPQPQALSGVQVGTSKKNSTQKAAQISNLSVDHNFMQGNEKGMLIHLKFAIENCQGEDCQVAVYFYEESGKQLADKNQQYKTDNGFVSVGSHFSPAFGKTNYQDFKIFMPYRELDLGPGKYDLKFYASIFHHPTRTFIGSSDYTHFYWKTD